MKLSCLPTESLISHGRDANTDIAVLQIEDKNFARKGITELVFSKDDPRVGEFAVALGAPFG